MIDNTVKDPGRVKIQEKIIELEKAGIFDKDVEDDPETIPLEPEMINYLKDGFKDKMYNKFAYYQAVRFFDRSVADKKVIILIFQVFLDLFLNIVIHCHLVLLKKL